MSLVSAGASNGRPQVDASFNNIVAGNLTSRNAVHGSLTTSSADVGRLQSDDISTGSLQSQEISADEVQADLIKVDSLVARRIETGGDEGCEQADNPELLAQVNAYDRDYVTRYYPLRPSSLVDPPFKPQYVPPDSTVYPWPLNQITIPATPGESVVPNVEDGFAKFLSISYYIHMYAGINPFTFQQTDQYNTLFLTDKNFRGPNNFRKKLYMFALRACSMPNYQTRVSNFVNKCYTDFTVHRRPVLSSFQSNLIDFFLSVHLGDAEYPDNIKQYFLRFTEAIGDPTGSTRDEAVMFGWRTAPCVQEYFASRLPEATRDPSCFVYHWNIAGMSPISLVSESLHNIIAFNQFSNMMDLLVRPIADGSAAYNLFDIFKTSPTPPPYTDANTWKNVVVQEAYRLLVPNTTTFSRTTFNTEAPPPSGAAVQARHVHQVLMVQSWGGEIPYGTPNPAVNFTTAQTGAAADYVFDFDATGACPDVFPNPLSQVDPTSAFEENILDGETVIDSVNPLSIPVFDTLKYTPFGLGYRRCAGEIFTYFVTIQMMERFKDLNWSVEALTPGAPASVPLAPFKTVPNDLYGYQ